MNPQIAQTYLRNKVLTATPEQLQLMLFDGALRFAEQARIAMTEKKFETSFTMILRVQKIITELSGSMKRDLAPELCGKLASLYNFAYRNLVQANVHRTIEPLVQAIDVLRYQRETWVMLLDQLGKQKAADFASRLDIPAPSSNMEASISMQG